VVGLFKRVAIDLRPYDVGRLNLVVLDPIGDCIAIGLVVLISIFMPLGFGTFVI